MGNVTLDVPVYESIRTAATCTTSYAAANDSSTFKLCANDVGFDLQLTIVKGTSTSFEFLVEGSNDGTTFFTQYEEAYAAGVSTIKKNEHTVAGADLATTDRIFKFYKRSGFSQYRIRFKETGAGTGTIGAAVAKIAGQPGG